MGVPFSTGCWSGTALSRGDLVGVEDADGIDEHAAGDLADGRCALGCYLVRDDAEQQGVEDKHEPTARLPVEDLANPG
jgi:hypothetical protein